MCWTCGSEEGTRVHSLCRCAVKIIAEKTPPILHPSQFWFMRDNKKKETGCSSLWKIVQPQSQGRSSSKRPEMLEMALGFACYALPYITPCSRMCQCFAVLAYFIFRMDTSFRRGIVEDHSLATVSKVSVVSFKKKKIGMRLWHLKITLMSQLSLPFTSDTTTKKN